jgi:hypothetical protein
MRLKTCVCVFRVVAVFCCLVSLSRLKLASLSISCFLPRGFKPQACLKPARREGNGYVRDDVS